MSSNPWSKVHSVKRETVYVKCEKEAVVILLLPSHFSPVTLCAMPFARCKERRNKMLKNYLKLVLRNIQRNKGYSFINIAGLVIGTTCFILIMLFIQYELSYINFHQNSDRIFRIICQLPGEEFGMTEDILAIIPALLASAIKEAFPEVESTTKSEMSIE